jgi:hypothetical protein
MYHKSMLEKERESGCSMIWGLVVLVLVSLYLSCCRECLVWMNNLFGWIRKFGATKIPDYSVWRQRHAMGQPKHAGSKERVVL